WLALIMVMASCVAVLFGDKIRSQSKPFLYLFQFVAAKDPVHELCWGLRQVFWITMISTVLRMAMRPVN
ncbi:hypothetical protein ACET66_18295, partial [Aeromonas simiae]|uniref:hypothetical protein n=1 Tax=Aeromonas simiae TaxID=218936 RepID=UPI0038CFEB1C